MILGLYRLAIGIALLGSVVWQISDRVANGLFRPAEYFSYFSIDTSIAAGFLTLFTGYLALKKRKESKFVNIARLSMAVASVILGVVYHLLLADAAPDIRDVGYVWPVLPNEIIHTYAPIALAIDYLISLKSPKLRLRAFWWVAVWPLAWLGFSLIRGSITDWWPYWFINPNGDGGVTTVVTYVGAITVFFLSTGLLMHGLRRQLGRLAKN